MQKTRSNCFRTKSLVQQNTITYFAELVPTYFHLRKNRVTLLLIETIAGSFLKLMMFICKAIIYHYSKRQFVVILIANQTGHALIGIFTCCKYVKRYHFLKIKVFIEIQRGATSDWRLEKW